MIISSQIKRDNGTPNVSRKTKHFFAYHKIKYVDRVCMFISLLPRPKIITQKVYYYITAWTITSGFLLASSYILNQPISINLCITMWVQPMGFCPASDILLLWQLHGFSLTPSLSPSIQFSFPAQLNFALLLSIIY